MKTPIYSDDPNAISLLQERIAKLEAMQEKMRETNKLLRKCGLRVERGATGGYYFANDRKEIEAAAAALVEFGYSEPYRLLAIDFLGRFGFPDYSLKNNSANIARLKKRLASLMSETA